MKEEWELQEYTHCLGMKCLSENRGQWDSSNSNGERHSIASALHEHWTSQGRSYGQMAEQHAGMLGGIKQQTTANNDQQHKDGAIC